MLLEVVFSITFINKYTTSMYEFIEEKRKIKFLVI